VRHNSEIFDLTFREVRKRHVSTWLLTIKHAVDCVF